MDQSGWNQSIYDEQDLLWSFCKTCAERTMSWRTPMQWINELESQRRYVFFRWYCGTLIVLWYCQSIQCSGPHLYNRFKNTKPRNRDLAFTYVSERSYSFFTIKKTYSFTSLTSLIIIDNKGFFLHYATMRYYALLCAAMRYYYMIANPNLLNLRPIHIFLLFIFCVLCPSMRYYALNKGFFLHLRYYALLCATTTWFV